MINRKTSFIEAAMRNKNIVIVITATLILLGVFALLQMPRNEFPQFTVRQGVVVGVYPGATSEEVEEQLTKEVENYIFGFQEVKKSKTYSYSREGIMYIFVELNDDVKNADQFWSKLKHGLIEFKATLPSGVLALIANSDFGDTSALLITLSSDSKSYKELEFQLGKLEAECRKIPATSKIKHFGLQKEKIFVNVKPEKLNEYNIKTISLLTSYQSNGMIGVAGELKDGKNNLAVHLPANFESEKDLANQIVYSDPNGNVVRLKDIATIERKYDKPDSYIKQNGTKTILLSLEMQPGNNIVEFGKDIDNTLAKFQKQCPDDIKVAKISELPKYVDDAVSNFMEEFLLAILAVILVTMILLPFRVALVAAITVPISVLITLCFMYFFGVELHTVSLATLIIVLGMIVDNSIVVIDNHVEKVDHGYSIWHAAIKSAKDLASPIIFATLAILAAYIPLGFMVPGTAGEFMASMPIVVAIALISSILIALLLVPYLNFLFIKKGLKKSNNKKQSKSMLDIIQLFFDKTLEVAFKFPKTVVAIVLGIIVLAIVIFNNLDQKMFPEMERNQFAVEVYLPTGSSIESTAKIIDSLESVLIKDKRVTNVTSFVGTSSPRFHTVYAPQMPASNYGQLLINTISDKATREIVNEYRSKYTNNFANAHVKWKILAMQLNPPVEIRISSDSIKDIRLVEKQVTEIAKRIKGIEWMRNDWDEKRQNIMVNLDNDRANLLGYQKAFVSTSIMVGLNSVPLTTIWEKDYPVAVCLTQENTETKDMKTLEDQYITSMSSFKAMPLRSFATLTPEWTEGTITRRNGVRTLTIKIDNEPNANANEIFKEIKSQVDVLKLPEGTTVNYGGDLETSLETTVPMGQALMLSIVLIFFILLFQFKRIKLSLLIMSTMLLVLPGIAFGFIATGYPFSTTAFIGIISLCGMVVRNGIILIDYARELNEKEKFSIYDAALAAGKRRMRPIFLTSAAAAVGVIPMIISKSPLWGPLGTVICFGLLVSMVLTLYTLPILYSLAYGNKSKKNKKWPVSFKAVPIILIIISFFISVNKTDAQTLSLDSCKRLAQINNNKIKEAEFEIKAAEEQRKNAFTNYFPNISASAVAMRSSDYLIKSKTPELNLPVYDGDPANIANATEFAYIPPISINMLDYLNTASVSVSMPLYAGGRIRNGNQLAALGVDVSRKQKALTNIEVLIRTEELYWTIISLKEKEKTLQFYKILLDTLYRDVNNYNSAGIVQRNDLLKVQLKQNELQANRLKLENGIIITTRALCQHIGIEYDSSLRFENNQSLNSSLLIQPDAEDIVSNRIEYSLLNKAIEAEELQRKMTRGEYLPQLAVTGMGMFVDAMDKTNNNSLALLTLSVPISDWWGGTHKTRQQQMKIEKAKITFNENTELLVLQIEQAKNEVNEFYFQIEVAKKSVEQSLENLKVVNDNYSTGTVGISDLLEAQAIYQNALDNYNDVQCSYQIKKAKYLQSTGNYF